MWRIGLQTCVTHGNPNNAGNVRTTADRLAFNNGNEPHADLPDLDRRVHRKNDGQQRWLPHLKIHVPPWSTAITAHEMLEGTKTRDKGKIVLKVL